MTSATETLLNIEVMAGIDVSSISLLFHIAFYILHSCKGLYCHGNMLLARKLFG